MSGVHIDHSLFLCKDRKCCDHVHIEAIDRLYSEITEALLGANQSLYSKKNGNYKQVFGWNEMCKEAHSQARNAFLTWVQASKPRSGLLYNDMRKTRAHFKLSLRQCQSEDKKTRGDY